MSVVPRPLIRSPSSTIRAATSFFVRALTAALTSPVALCEDVGQLFDDRPGGVGRRLVAGGLVGDGVRRGDPLGPDGLHPLEDVVAVVTERREVDRLDRAVRGDHRGNQLAAEG